eukprot:Sspe_Gene.51373::Locus_28526_Transcript_1_1_Confidence_1.000_Length_3695::g.51373::m.51373/K10396/KIF5; kinesin family member 5
MSGKAPDEGGNNSNNIKVCARFRPMNRLEIEAGGQEVTKLCDPEVAIKTTDGGQNYKFTFDHVFTPESSQKEVYDLVGLQVVADVFKGYNGTIFVYGQTGSGKTHTMMGPSAQKLQGYCDDAHLKGIIPRVVEQIFVNVENADPNIEFSIKVSYVEIYMEKIRDLFDPTKTNLQLHEDFKGGKGVYVADATEHYVADAEEIFQLMRQGAANRAVASTRMNDDSSRSHSIFSIAITQKHSVKLDQRTGKLFLVDLAGSEKVGKTKAEGQQLEEAKLINKSLSCLGQVINALTDKKSTHIPYRDSKLTRLLQDSLGGNARTSLIICCSVSEYNQQETLSTLRFGQRAKSITNKARVNRELTVGEYKILLAKLEKEIQQLRAAKGLPQMDEKSRDAAAELANLEAQLQEEKAMLQSERLELQDELQEMRDRDGIKESLIQQYRYQLQAYQDEVECWEVEYNDLQLKLHEVEAMVQKERKVNTEKMAVIAKSNAALEEFAKDVLGLKVTTQRLHTQLEQQSLAGTGGPLDEDQEKQVAQWRKEKEESMKDEQQFRKDLRQKLQEFAEIDAKMADPSSEVRELRQQVAEMKRAGWLRYTLDGPISEAIPDSPEGMRAEIEALRRALKEMQSSDTVPRSAYEAAKEAFKSELQGKETELSTLRAVMERQASETKELRNSLLKDLQSRCEKVIDLELALEEARDQYKHLVVASSNKALRRRVQILEEQQNQQAADIAEILNANSSLRLEYQLAEKKLAIRTDRIENLKVGLADEKMRTKTLIEQFTAEKKKLKEEAARYKEELAFWKKHASGGGSASKTRRVVKILKGGQRHEHKTTSPNSGDLDLSLTASRNGGPLPDLDDPVPVPELPREDTADSPPVTPH